MHSCCAHVQRNVQNVQNVAHLRKNLHKSVLPRGGGGGNSLAKFMSTCFLVADPKRLDLFVMLAEIAASTGSWDMNSVS